MERKQGRSEHPEPKTKEQGTQAYAWWLMHNKDTQTGQDISYGPEPRPALRTITPGFYIPATKGKYALGTATQVRASRMHQRTQTARYLEWPACLFLLPTPPESSKGKIMEASPTPSTSKVHAPPTATQGPADDAMSTTTISPPRSLKEQAGEEDDIPTGRMLCVRPSTSRQSRFHALLDQLHKLPAPVIANPPAEPASENTDDQLIDIPDLDPNDPLDLAKGLDDDDPDVPIQ